MKKENLVSIIFILINIFVMLGVIFLSRGYKYNDQSGKIEKTGTLIVESEPNNAKIFLNDKEIGVSSLQLNELSAGKYNLKISKNDYVDINTSIEISENFVTKKFYKLLPVSTQISNTLTESSIKIAYSSKLDQIVYIKKNNSNYDLAMIQLSQTANSLQLIINSPKTIFENLDNKYINCDLFIDNQGKYVYLINKTDLIFSYINTSNTNSIIDLLPKINFIPEKILFDNYNNTIFVFNNSVFLFDKENLNLYFKYYISSNSYFVFNSYFYILDKQNKKVKILNNNYSLNDFDIFDLQLENINFEENNEFCYSSNRHTLVVSTSTHLFVINNIKKTINKFEVSGTVKLANLERDDVYISIKNNFIIKIDYSLSRIVTTYIDLPQNSKYISSPSKDLALIFDLGKLYITDFESKTSTFYIDIGKDLPYVQNIYLDSNDNLYFYSFNDQILSIDNAKIN